MNRKGRNVSPLNFLPPQGGVWLSGRSAAAEPSWVWDGYLAAGCVTLLVSQWKSGKTTLLALLLSRMKAGGELAGRAVAPGRAAVVSEEDERLWAMRHRKLDFGDAVCLFCQPFPGRRPGAKDWHDLTDALLSVHDRHGLSLAVIDPLAMFFPGGSENNAVGMMDAAAPLRRLTARGLAVLVLHHPRKGEVAPGQAARGSGALAGWADVLLEMRWGGRDVLTDRRRRLEAWSRFEQTPRRLLIELNAEGTEYLVCPEPPAAESDAEADVLAVLEAAGPLTREEVLARWPGERPPAVTTLCRLLDRAVARGRLCRTGRGRRNDPYRYTIAGAEEGDAGG
jgi:hypothetical protein